MHPMGRMPTYPLRWLFVLLGLFVVAVTADLYLSSASAQRAATTTKRLDVAEFLTAARAGELTGGRIVYRGSANGLADVSAQRKTAAETYAVETTARLTDTDLALLRERRFAEDDAAGVAKAQPVTLRQHAQDFAHGSMLFFGVLLVGFAYL